MSAVSIAVCLGTLAWTTPVVAQGEVVAAGPVAMEGFEDYDWWFEGMELEQAQRRGATGAGVTVALIDEAPDLRAGEFAGRDVRLRRDCFGNPAQSFDVSRYGSGGVDDEAGHGTAMASLIVGSGRGNAPGGVGVRGVAPEAELLVYDVSPTPGLCAGEEVGPLVRRAVKDGADIISVSLGLDEGLVPAVQQAIDAGVVVVGAMYNGLESTGSRYPSELPGVVAVQPINREVDAPPWTIPSQAAVISSPAVEIGVPYWTPATGRLESAGWGSGTSPATAIVSGALAAVKSKYPDATGNQLIQHLIHRVGGDGGFGWNTTYGFGIVSVREMVQSSPTQWPDENPLVNGPRQGFDDYPEWVSSEVEDPPGKGENAPEADGEGGSGSAEDSGGSGAPESSAGSDQGVAEDASGEESGGVPGWAWGLGGLVLAGVLVAGVVIARRGGAGVAGNGE